MSLRKRTPTALVLLVLVFCVIQFAPPLIYFLVLQAVIVASLLEFYNLAGKKKLLPRRTVGVVFALIIAASFYSGTISLELSLLACFLVAAVYFLIDFNNLEKLGFFTSSISVTFFGALYLGFTLNHFFPLREERGPFAVYFLFAVIFLGDTGAYFFGKLFGRHKLAPVASPRKTVEGSAGGILLACLAALIGQQVLLKEITPLGAVACGVLIHAVAQVSDPLESLFKRAVGVKDSSHVLPGHGGFLDRIDSLILAVPLFYHFVRFFWN